MVFPPATRLAGNPDVEVVVPKTGVVAGVYVQAISAYAPHPNAAKLWMEYLYSDEGQIGWLKGYCHPIALPISQRTARFRRTSWQRCRRPRLIMRPSSRRLMNRARPKWPSPNSWDTVVGANVQVIEPDALRETAARHFIQATS